MGCSLEKFMFSESSWRFRGGGVASTCAGTASAICSILSSTSSSASSLS